MGEAIWSSARTAHFRGSAATTRTGSAHDRLAREQVHLARNSTRAFDNLTLTFRATDIRVFCAHHYRYRPDRSTFLVEVTPDTWTRAGFETMGKEETIRYCERVFAKDLGGHRILSNNSYWRQFPTIWNERWSFGNVVLLGDALRTAHFSIGSGTRLAMEDAVALFKAFEATGIGDVAAAFAQFQRTGCHRCARSDANASLRWYEDMDRLVTSLSPLEFRQLHDAPDGSTTRSAASRSASRRRTRRSIEVAT